MESHFKTFYFHMMIESVGHVFFSSSYTKFYSYMNVEDTLFLIWFSLNEDKLGTDPDLFTHSYRYIAIEKTKW